MAGGSHSRHPLGRPEGTVPRWQLSEGWLAAAPTQAVPSTPPSEKVLSLNAATQIPGQPTSPPLGKGQDWTYLSHCGSVVRSPGFCHHTNLVLNLSPAISEPCTTLGKLLQLSGPQTPCPPNRDNDTNFPGFL